LSTAAAVFGAVCAALGYYAGYERANKVRCRDLKLGGTVFSGCEWKLIGRYRRADVEVYRCARCGDVDVTWVRREDTVTVFEDADALAALDGEKVYVHKEDLL
jgi:hypothetical protein